ncbi:MAG: hypothetical protein ACYTFZ_05370 [Planctomycetota bacterium]|jgi:hypothetical protein
MNTLGRVRWLILVTSLPLILLAAGCKSFRADAGLGFGIGAEAKLPYLLHTGFGVGAYKYAGFNYGEGWHVGREDKYWEASVSLFVWHMEEMNNCLDPDLRSCDYKDRHTCAAILPYAYDLLIGTDTRHSTPVEVRAHLLPISIRLGWDPAQLFSDK